MEQWKPVVGFEEDYEVSDLGRVRSRPRKGTKGGVLKPRKTGRGRGHLSVALHRLGKFSNRHVHRLVLEAFVCVRPDGMEACHANDEASDNQLSNLRWDTHKNNSVDAMRNKRLGKSRAQN